MTQRYVTYPYQNLVIKLDGMSWSIDGTAILENDKGEAYAGSIEISNIDRLDSDGALDFEAMPINLFTPQEQLRLLDAIRAALPREELNQYYAERMYDYD